MKLNIDLTKIKKKSLNLNQYLLLIKLYYRLKDKVIDFEERKGDYLFLRDSGYLTISGSSVELKEKAIDFIEGRSERDYDDLADKFRELFPKGAKAGKYPWRSSVNELSKRFKSLDKHSDLSTFTDDEILKTTERYINRFTMSDMDSGMQISKYFIEKDGSSTLLDLLISEKENPISRYLSTSTLKKKL